MSFVMRISGEGFTTEKYDELVRRLETMGEGSPAGRLFHVCFGDPQNLRVSDIWDTQENFQRFFGVVSGLMQELGITGSAPEFFDVHNFIIGEAAGKAAA